MFAAGQNSDVTSSDVIVVGGGSAGCVIAARLSENPQTKVVLIDAGDEPQPGRVLDQMNAAEWRCFYNWDLYWPDAFWSHKDEVGEMSGGIMIGRVLGGGGAVNGMQAQRGVPDDYDEWSALGVRGWSYADVLPYFKRLETDLDFGTSTEHGGDGPIHIQRTPPALWGPFTKAVRDGWTRKGMPWLEDVNAEGGDGVGAVPMNWSSDGRHSTARRYLNPTARARDNLTVLCRSTVSRVLFEDGRAVGVDLDGDRRIMANAVVVCAGAINSPAILMRSGLGPGEALKESGLEVLADRPGVGGNLRNHSLVNLSAHLTRKGQQARGTIPSSVMVGRYSSGLPGCSETDMAAQLYDRLPGAPLKRDPLSRSLAALSVIIYKPYSSGRLTLNSANLLGTPRVNINFLEDRRDYDRIRQALAFGWATLTDESVKPYVDEVFLTGASTSSPHLQHGFKAWLASELGALALASGASTRRRLLTRAGASILDLKDGEIPDSIIRSAVLGMGHWVGSCRLGAADDRDAVVDSDCRVIGVEGVWIVDGSILPTPMRGGTSLPIMMAAEKGAVHIKESLAGRKSK